MRSRWGNLYFWGPWLWWYVSVQCLLSVVFLTLWFVNIFLTLNFKASIIYRFFSLSVTCGIFALWFSLNQMFVIKSVSFDTDRVERTTPSRVSDKEVFARQKTYREQPDTFLLQRTTCVVEIPVVLMEKLYPCSFKCLTCVTVVACMRVSPLLFFFFFFFLLQRRLF